MNVTSNYTTVEDEDDGFIPIWDPEQDEVQDESQEVEFVESTILKMLLKFVHAMIILTVCGGLLAGTFLLITICKRKCRSKMKDDGNTNNGSAGTPLHSVIVTPPTEEDSTSPEAIPSSSSGKHNMKVPASKKALLRRASGPFGSEALTFVGEQYTMKTMEKEGHHHHHAHDQHGPPHFHSAQSHHSHSGNSAQLSAEEEANETKSKWNCFKGNKE